MIRLFAGNILESKAEVITVTVNCHGVMGKGLALEAKQKFPRLFTQYRAVCDQNGFKPGQVRIFEVDDKKFLCFATKDDWRKPSQLEWIDAGLAYLAQHIDKFTSIALPPLGCGNGDLNWYSVLNLMLKHLEGKDCDIRIYPPK